MLENAAEVLKYCYIDPLRRGLFLTKSVLSYLIMHFHRLGGKLIH